MKASIKRQVIASGFAAIAASGADRWLAPLARGRGAILTFHHVRPPDPEPFRPNALLEITPDFLDRTLSVVRSLGFVFASLDEVPARLAEPEGPPFCVLTFDDGYRDNRLHAAPILARHGAPWTLFVATDYAAQSGRLWWRELEEVVRRARELRRPESGETIPCETLAEKEAAFARVYADLRAGPEERLREVLAGWCRAFGIDGDALVARACMDFDEIEDLASDAAVSIGAHTLSHPMLAKHDATFVWREITESRALLARRLKRPIRHFAYPVGDPTSAGPREFALAAQAGFATAVTTRPGHLFAGHLDHLTALPRVSVNGLWQTETALKALLSGVPFLAWNRLKRIDAT